MDQTTQFKELNRKLDDFDARLDQLSVQLASLSQQISGHNRYFGAIGAFALFVGMEFFRISFLNK